MSSTPYLVPRTSNFLRAFRTGLWLGWQIESNWTKPWLFVAYAIAQPIIAALVLTFIYRVIAASGGSGDLFSYAYVGSAVYVLVGGLMEGISWAVIEDRERMGMLKYISLAPSSLRAYLLGRGVAKVATSMISVPIVLAMGALWLGVDIHWSSIDVIMLLPSFVLGIVIIACAGLILAGATMNIARHGHFLGQSVAGSLFIFSGVLFPITALPGPLQAVSRVLPFSYWLEAMRRSLLGMESTSGFEGVSDGTLMLILLGLTAAMIVIALPIQRLAEHRAKERGLLDMNTSY